MSQPGLAQMPQAPADWEAMADQVADQVAGLSMQPSPVTPELPDQAQQGNSGESSGPGSISVEGGLPGVPGAADVELVDHALRDALCHPKNRASVLKLEEEVEAFVLNSQATQHVFGRDMTSYERLLAHRTAQHWGLETSTISQGPDQGKIVAYRAPHTRVPKVKLSQVPVTMSELPSPAASVSPTSPAPAPRVLVRKRPDRLGPRGGGGQQHADLMHGGGGGMPFPDGAAAAGFRSVEERQQEYHRARARIFGGEGAGAGGFVMQPPQLAPPRGPVYGGGAGLPTSPMHNPFPASPPRAVGSGGFVRPVGGGWVAMGGGGGGNGGRKAVLRNKHEDLNDPDFRRHRSGPRFDPGFGEELEAQQSLYIRPTYSSEFPELGGHPSPSGRGGSRGGGGPGPRQSPRRGGPPGSSGMPPSAGGGPAMGAGAQMAAPAGMYPMSPYGGQMPPGMMAAGPMGHFMMPQGVMMAGPMPGGMAGGMGMYTGGAAMPFHPAAAGYYPVPAPGGWGYYPMQPGGSGGQEAMAAMQYAVPYAYPGMAAGAGAAMGGIPGGPTAAAAMAAMTAPMPGPVSPSPHGSGAQSPHYSGGGGGMSRQRSNGARTRNSAGSTSGHIGNMGSPEGMQQQAEHAQHGQHQSEAAPAAAAAPVPEGREQGSAEEGSSEQ